MREFHPIQPTDFDGKLMDQVSGFTEVAVEYVFPFTGAHHSFSDFRNKNLPAFKKGIT